MNFEQCEIRNKNVMLNAIEWANDRECDYITYEEMAIICAYLNITLSKHFHNNFVETSSPNNVRASGAFKSVYKAIDKVRENLLKYDIEELA